MSLPGAFVNHFAEVLLESSSVQREGEWVGNGVAFGFREPLGVVEPVGQPFTPSFGRGTGGGGET